MEEKRAKVLLENLIDTLADIYFDIDVVEEMLVRAGFTKDEIGDALYGDNGCEEYNEKFG